MLSGTTADRVIKHVDAAEDLIANASYQPDGTYQKYLALAEAHLMFARTVNEIWSRK